MGTFEDELKKNSCKKIQMSLIKKILIILFLLSPISSSFGEMVTHVQTGTFEDDHQEDEEGRRDGIIAGIEFNKDGTKMFTSYGFDPLDPADDYHMINEYNLSIPYDISTKTYAGTNERCELGNGADGVDTANGAVVYDLEFSSDGMKIFITSRQAINGADKDKVYRFDLTTAYDISTCSYAQETTDLDTAANLNGSNAGDFAYTLSGGGSVNNDKNNRLQGVEINDDGTKLFLAWSYVGGSSRLLEFTLTTPYDLTTMTLVTNAGIDIGEDSPGDVQNPASMRFSSNGKRIFIVSHQTSNNQGVTQISLTRAYDTSSFVIDGKFNLATSISPTNIQPRGIAFNASGLKMYLGSDRDHNGLDQVMEYDLVCPFNLFAGKCPSITENNDRHGLAIAQMEIAKRTIDHSTDTALNRLKWIRRNKDKQNLTNLNINFNFTNQKLASLTKVVKTSASKIKKTNEKKDIFYWSEGSFAIGRIGDTSIASTRKIDTDAVTLGADKFTNDNGIKGLAFRIGRNNIDVGNSGSNLDTDTYNITYYTTSPIKDDTKFLDTVIGFGSLNSDILTMLDGKKLIAQREGNQLYGTLRIKDEIKKDNLTYIPSGRFDIGHTILQDYDEKGTGAVHVEEQHIRSKKIRAGLAAVEDLSDDDYTYKRHGKIEYVADIDRSSNFKYTYSGDTNSSFNDTLHSGSLHNISGEVGVDIVLPSSFSIFLIYERDQALGSGYTDKIHIAIGYLPNKETNYAFSIDGSDEFKSNYVLSKNINDYLIDFKLTNDFMSPKDYDEASFNLIRKF